MTDGPEKKKTIVLDQADLESLRNVARLQRVSETEVLRRGIRLTEKLLNWEQEGGEIVLKRGSETFRVVFL